MTKQLLDLKESLETGFIDRSHVSNHLLQPEFLVNSNDGQKVLTTIKEQLQQCDEFWFSVAFVTTSGVASLKQEFVELENKKIKGKVLVSQYLNFTQPEALKQLLMFNNIEVRIAVDSNFHAKGYLFGNNGLNNLIIGSSNFTANALTSNKEWNLKVTASKNSQISIRALEEFSLEFSRSTPVTLDFIDKYQDIYAAQKELSGQFELVSKGIPNGSIEPNEMQIDALEKIDKLRHEGKTKALLISATGTGKTYLSAFDAKNLNPNRLLFVVHRANIAKAAMKTYKTIFGSGKSFGMYSGDSKELEKDFVFSTVQTISRDDNLSQFDKQDFDYIVIDETHRARADSYRKILEYFEAKFILGMTATPERTDGLDVFELFDHNIAYEIRLQKALEMKILSPFHYYGITDISIDGDLIDELSDFKTLINQERIKHILSKIALYGCDNGEVRGLVFCSHVDECKALSTEFNDRGFKSISLTGSNSEKERNEAIERLESPNLDTKLDYIFTVDIFNEGIDIPLVNQVVMLRPTESAIVFVQQLGRGLRKAKDKDYLTVVDFIGNYKNNFLVPIALYGDTSYNKDTLRKMMSSNGSVIPGSSTINFDSIAKERIYSAIDAANLQTKRDLIKDYNLLKYKLGYAPLMMDFIEHGTRDPFSYVKYSKSFYGFAESCNQSLRGKINSVELKLLQVFSNEINNAKRLEESLILKELLDNSQVSIGNLKNLVEVNYGYLIDDKYINSYLNNLNLNFVTEKINNKLKPVGEINGFKVVQLAEDKIVFHPEFLSHLSNKTFKIYLRDSVEYSIFIFNKNHKSTGFVDGFHLYCKYSRKDVFRILNWDVNPVAQNVGGYILSKDKTNCPIFVNYHKADDISDTTKYDDYFINESEFEWMSKSRRSLESPDVKAIRNHRNGLRIPLFVKKNNDEGAEFYYMGDITPKDNGFEQTVMPSGQGKSVSVVKVIFDMKQPVKHEMYKYLLGKQTST